ncbi:MAG: trypsin-like peptidase domain-containing protein [Phycisphaeraceae bacterium]|nr:trypsin-like peptidase domain-containing protein [Phycisphaerales bacterium]MCB9859562.1 trypsin-like peptidase domain-containing protein [Phycisphaeraceae bacterium]
MKKSFFQARHTPESLLDTAVAPIRHTTSFASKLTCGLIFGLTFGVGHGFASGVAMGNAVARSVAGGVNAGANAVFTRGKTREADVEQGVVVAEPVLELVQPDVALDPETDRAIEQAQSLSKAFRYVAKVAEPSVVHITTYEQVQLVRRSMWGAEPMGTRRQQAGLGTGVIMRTDDQGGYIVTNNHVVGTGDDLVVHLYDGRDVQAQLVGRDPQTDLAVVRIDADRLTSAQFGDSDDLEVGDWVVAVGNPLGLDNTVTSGIVSAKGRAGLNPGQLRSRTAEMNTYEDFIQTDAAINPGNSGGPLLDLRGHVMGINSQIATTGRGSIGLGFAIPSNIAQPVMEMIISGGTVRRGYLGVNMGAELSYAEAIQMGIPTYDSSGGGVALERVVQSGPADSAGLRNGDIIVKFNGKPSPTVNRLRNLIAITPPGQSVSVEYVRNGALRTTSVQLGDLRIASLKEVGAIDVPNLGMWVIELPDRLPIQLERDGVNGALVYEVEAGSAAERAGLRSGDIIEQIDHRAVQSVSTLVFAADRLKNGEAARVGIVRQESGEYLRGYVDITP